MATIHSRHHHLGSMSGQQPPAVPGTHNQKQAQDQPPMPDTKSRPFPQVPPPASYKPTDSDLYLYDGHERKVNHEYLKQHFYHEGRLTEAQALYILEAATNILSREPNMVPLKSPVTICGDIHGQYYDLMKMFEVGGNLQDSLYLFLGDYVDRGDFGIECLLYLYSLKIHSPQHIVLLRGNHECRHLTEYFTFKRECLHKYSEAVYEACLRSFQALPIAALVDGKFFCVHGGLSPLLMNLSDLSEINRFQEPGSHGLLCDILWSDPISNFGHETDPSSTGPLLDRSTTFTHNATRGCSYFYTYEAVCQFLDRNGLLTLIRGHEAQDAGYTMYRKTPKRNFPSVITIFSAPNYLDVYHNRGAILKYANKNITIRQYNSTSHPYWLPNFMDAFTWSLPFVGEKITQMLLAILSICSQEELEESDSEEDRGRSLEDLAARKQAIKSKILAVGRMQKVFQLLREEAENASELAATGVIAGSSTGVSRPGVDALSVQDAKINRSIRTFDDARRSDIANERLPDFDVQRPSSPMFPVPSMRSTSRRASASGESLDMEDLIKRTLEEDVDGGVVENIAEKIARGRSLTGKPGALKRHDTA